MSKWLFPTLSEILLAAETEAHLRSPVILEENIVGNLARARHRAEWAWSGSIVALGQLLHHPDCSLGEPGDYRGLILCGPLPLFTDPHILQPFLNWVFIPDLLTSYLHAPLQLLPAAPDGVCATSPQPTPLLPLSVDDPLATEQFCLVRTPCLGLVLVIGDDRFGFPHFQFSFDRQVLHHCCEALLQRIPLGGRHQAQVLHDQMNQFALPEPNPYLVSRFTRHLLEHLTLNPDPITPDNSLDLGTILHPPANPAPSLADLPLAHAPNSPVEQSDLKLLQAITHEVRTPLATIRTLTRLLMKRQDLDPVVLKRLQVIDQECTEQIDRFGLIFRAAELEADAQGRSKSFSQSLVTTHLDEVFHHSIPRWQKQADRRGLDLQVRLPEQLPTVLSDPTMLEQALTGLMERFTRHLPPRSQIEVRVSLAGSRLKLQLQSSLPPEYHREARLPGLADEAAESLGNLLMFQPETGSLSLNLDVTKNLFQAMGGKLTIREKSDRGEILTVFLPLELSS